MLFEFNWVNYKTSDLGIRNSNYFQNLRTYIQEKDNRLLELINAHKIEKWDEKSYENFCDNVNYIVNLILNCYDLEKLNFDDIEDCIYLYEQFLMDENDENFTSEWYFGSYEQIEVISTALTLVTNNFLLPYFFERQIYLLFQIFQSFELPLPEIPKKTDILGRFNYYIMLCESIHNFRINYKLSHIDACNFIYGFALNNIHQYSISDVLPPPRNVYFIGGGAGENDWSRQVHVKIGSSEKVIPDYILNPILSKGVERADWIIEAKYSISTEKQLETYYIQAKSYAQRFAAKGYVLASKEGIWISDATYLKENLKFYSWLQLEQNDDFCEVDSILRNKKNIFKF